MSPAETGALWTLQAQAAFLAAAEKYGQEDAEVEALLAERDAAYLQLLSVPSAAGTPGLAPSGRIGNGIV